MSYAWLVLVFVVKGSLSTPKSNGSFSVT